MHTLPASSSPAAVSTLVPGAPLNIPLTLALRLTDLSDSVGPKLSSGSRPCPSHPCPPQCVVSPPPSSGSGQKPWSHPSVLSFTFLPPPSLSLVFPLSLPCNNLLGKPAVFHLQNISFIRTRLTATTTNSSTGHQHLPCKSPPPSGPWTSTVAPTTVYCQHCGQSILSEGKLGLSENPEMKPCLT